MSAPVRLLAVDGPNVVMRCAAVRWNLRSEDVPPVDVLTEVGEVAMRQIRECADEVEASHLVVAFEGVGSWRRALFPEYKAQRTTSTLRWCVALVRWCMEFGVKMLDAAECEADDVLGTLARRFLPVTKARPDARLCVLSQDSDVLALAGYSFVECWQFGTASKGEAKFIRRDAAWVAEKYGIPSAAHLPTYKALVGEPGDNLPGVSKVGPVKARKLIDLFGHAANIESAAVNDRAVLPGPQLEQFRLACQLVRLRPDAPIGELTLRDFANPFRKAAP